MLSSSLSRSSGVVFAKWWFERVALRIVGGAAGRRGVVHIYATA